MQIVVVFRTLLQDRIAALNGRTVKHLLNQDLSAFVKLVGLSVVQVNALTIPFQEWPLLCAYNHHLWSSSRAHVSCRGHTRVFSGSKAC